MAYDMYDPWGEYNWNVGGNQDPNAQPIGERQADSPGGGPQGSFSQPRSSGPAQEAAAVESALSPGGAPASPVNPDGSISSNYNPGYNFSDPGPDLYPGGTTNPGGDPVEGPPMTDPPPPPKVPVKEQTSVDNVPGTSTGGKPPTGNTPPPPVGNNPPFNPFGFLGSAGGSLGSGFRGFNIPQSSTTPYTPQAIPRFTPPDLSSYDTQVMNALMGALGNSEWSDRRIAMMKEAQKEQALRMSKDLQESTKNRFAGLGRTGAGAENAILRRIGTDMAGNVLGSYRDVDLNAAEGRRSELLNTVGGIQSALSGRVGRDVSGYGAELSGADRAAEEAYRSWQSRMQMEAAALQRAMAEEAARLDWRRTDINSLMGLAQLMENSRQFNERMGFDWTDLNLRNVRG